ncbi:MAG: putative metal-dependent phosphoesterase TrpH [Oceanicoccus sp.]
MIVDLHSHSNASDGTLTPLQLLQRAEAQGVELMAITDHDTVAGFQAVNKQWQSDSMQLVAGVELSCLWGKQLIHVVGLAVDIDSSVLSEGLKQQQLARLERAQLIGQKLAKYGFAGGYEYVAEIAGSSQLGRPHFARFLLERGHVRSEKEAFKKYLGAGKAGDVKQTWPEMAVVLAWISASGGVAVLAHPLHYKMTNTKLRALLDDFKTAGGAAIEVISGKQPTDRTAYLAGLAEQFELAASIGSDFHRPDQPWAELGQMGVLPKQCQPVWELFKDQPVESMP